nr:MAG TPA: hypothetical protein [Caudoviricetes sp.]
MQYINDCREKMGLTLNNQPHANPNKVADF